MIATAPLSIEAIRRRLTTRVVARHVYLFDEVESTNAVLRDLARSGAADGTVVLAESQRRGRGRLGREWFSPAGVNLYASALFRDRLTAREAPVLSFIASLALADAVRDWGPHPAIKWPNDVLVGRRKLGGSLAECATRGPDVDYLILGVGVNLNVDDATLAAALGPAAGEATSLSAVLGREVDRNAFAAAYLLHLDDWALRYRTEGATPVLAAWRDRDILTGRRVAARGDRAVCDGRVQGVNDEGQLVVQDALGVRHVLLTEEITVQD